MTIRSPFDLARRSCVGTGIWLAVLAGIVLHGLLLDRAGAQATHTMALHDRPSTSAFDAEAGRLLRRYVGPDTYGANQQNWDATQDSSGVLYVANTDGVLVYDGHAWHTVPTAHQTGALTVEADGHGRVYVGSSGDFGVLRTDSLGRYHYVSLLGRVPEQHRSVQDVKRTVITDEGAYFQFAQKLFRWMPASQTMRVWSLSGSTFQFASVVRDTLFVNVKGRGLMTVSGDSLQRVPGGQTFSDRSVRFVLPHKDGGLLVGAYRGLFTRQGSSFVRFSTEVDELLRRAWLYAGTRLQDGTIAIGTIDHGLLLLAPDGTVRRHLRPRDKPVTGLYEDREGGLWALLDGGMVRYAVGAPFTEFGRDRAPEGIVLDIVRHRGRLHVSTMEATYRLETAADSGASFRRLDALKREMSSTPSWGLLSTGSHLFVGTVNGLAVQRRDGAVRYLLRGTQVFDLLRSTVDSSRIYAATETGLRVVARRGSTWTVEGDVPPDLEGKARMLAEDDDGTLWIGMGHGGVSRVEGLYERDSVQVDRFGPTDGLPQGDVAPYRWENEIVFGTGRGVYQFVPTPNAHFAPHTSIERPPIGSGDGRAHLRPDGRGHAWGTTGSGPGRWLQRNGQWNWRPGPLHRLRHKRAETVEVEDGGRTIWFGLWEGRVVRYVPNSAWPRRPAPARVIRVSEYASDSLLARARPDPASETRPTAQRGVRITYGTTSLVAPDVVEYQYKMSDADPNWSDWTARTQQSYPNLGPGSYTFSVRARLAYGDTTKTTRYSFAVLPPWYRTWWAYALYLLAGLGVIAGAVQWRTWQLRRRQEMLEATVEERTQEIETQKDTLAEQAERLQELDEAKTRFFANVSHEFRTPLTLILGPVRDLREQLRNQLSDAQAESMNVIEHNAQRLLRLVDQILGIARMDAGTYRLDARPTPLRSEVTRIARTFEPLAERAGLSLTVETAPSDGPPPGTDPVYVDREALEHIVGNLLSNAIKFTPENGTITVTVTETDDAAAMAVADTGPGIPEDERAAIFDRFQQVEEAGERSQEGAGIGLAFVRDLVDLHGGQIEVESTPGSGTTFTVRFRRGREHLSDADLAEDSPDAEHPMSASNRTDEASRTADVTGANQPSSGAAEDAPAPAEPSDPNEHKRLVLVVEDNADVRTYVRSILEPNFEVLEATDGEEGLEVARTKLPDVILADVMMPDMDGHEMTRALKDDPDTKAIPVIMVTARAGSGDEVEGLKVGADDYVTKPFDADVLRQRVGGVITLQERLREKLQAEGASDEMPSKTEGDDQSEIEQRARQAIVEHLTDPDFDVEALAKELAMSRSKLYREFRSQSDTTPSALITRLRMKRATSLLRDGAGSVTQVAYAVGYDRLSSFSRTFREHTGRSPSALFSDDE